MSWNALHLSRRPVARERRRIAEGVGIRTTRKPTHRLTPATHRLSMRNGLPRLYSVEPLKGPDHEAVIRFYFRTTL